MSKKEAIQQLRLAYDAMSVYYAQSKGETYIGTEDLPPVFAKTQEAIKALAEDAE
jgi:hypothetical protein